MRKKKAKLIFKHNYFEILEEGDYVLCAISGKEIPLTNLSYWNGCLLTSNNNFERVGKKNHK